jgi:hypothetical protein
VLHALQSSRCYLERCVGLTLVTDHNPLIYLQQQPNLSTRQARWQLFMSWFHYEWEYRPGRDNITDSISRNPALLAAVTRSQTPAVSRTQAPAVTRTDAPAETRSQALSIGGRQIHSETLKLKWWPRAQV